MKKHECGEIVLALEIDSWVEQVFLLEKNGQYLCCSTEDYGLNQLTGKWYKTIKSKPYATIEVKVHSKTNTEILFTNTFDLTRDQVILVQDYIEEITRV